MTEVNEAYDSTQNEALYEECDNYRSTYVSTTENMAYGQGTRAAQNEELQSIERNEDDNYYY